MFVPAYHFRLGKWLLDGLTARDFAIISHGNSIQLLHGNIIFEQRNDTFIFKMYIFPILISKKARKCCPQRSWKAAKERGKQDRSAECLQLAIVHAFLARSFIDWQMHICGHAINIAFLRQISLIRFRLTSPSKKIKFKQWSKRE